MKTRWSLFVLLVVPFLVAGCTAEPQPASKPAAATEATSHGTETTKVDPTTADETPAAAHAHGAHAPEDHSQVAHSHNAPTHNAPSHKSPSHNEASHNDASHKASSHKDPSPAPAGDHHHGAQVIINVPPASTEPAPSTGAAAGAVRAALPKASEPPQVSLIRTPDGGIQPQAAVDAQGTLHLFYYKGDPRGGDVFYVRKPAGQESFTSPLRVNSHPNSAVAAGTIRGAQLAIGKSNRVHVAWNGSKEAQPRGEGRKNDSPMLYTRTNDDGTAFEPQRNLIHEAYGLDGGGSVAADQAGNVFVAWHGNPAGDGEENRRVYVAISRDEGKTFAAEVPAYGEPTGACGCCGMKAFADSRGAIYMFYRTATDGVDRDMCLLASRDNGQSFQGSIVGKWQVATCPMSSETFAEGPAGIVGGWETSGQIYMGWINPQTGIAKPVSPQGVGNNRKHPALAVNGNGDTLLVWTEGTGWNRGGAVAWQLFDRAGQPTIHKGRRDGVPVWGLATVAAHPDGSFTIVY
jgi:hypothetical protein